MMAFLETENENRQLEDLPDSDVQTFLEKEENPNTERKTKDNVFSGFDDGISRDWERKSTAGRFATGRFWPCIWKISSVSKDQVNYWKFCILKIMPMVCFCGVPTHFSRWALAPTHFAIFIWGLSILLFSFINKIDFSLSVNGYCFFMINKIIHGCL